jgi:hypothetical protein
MFKVGEYYNYVFTADDINIKAFCSATKVDGIPLLTLKE